MFMMSKQLLLPLKMVFLLYENAINYSGSSKKCPVCYLDGAVRYSIKLRE